MKFIKLFFFAIIPVLLSGCKKTVNQVNTPINPSTPKNSVNQTLIFGTWRSVTDKKFPDYPERYFGADSFYYQNAENPYGMSYMPGTYHWEKNDTLYFYLTKVHVIKLTNDSLVFKLGSSEYRYINEHKPLLNPQGYITTIIQSVTTFDTPLEGPLHKTGISKTCGITTDQSGNIYFMDSEFKLLREITARDSTVHTVAGISDVERENIGEDGLPARSTHLDGTTDAITIDKKDNIYLIQNKFGNGGLRLLYKILGSDHLMRIICGNVVGYSGDGGAATKAAVVQPGDVKCDAVGNVYFSDQNNTVIRKISAVDGTISTIAGNTTVGNSGDGGPAKIAAIDVGAMAIDNENNVIFGTSNLTSIYLRKINTKTGMISTIAGSEKTISLGDRSDAMSAGFASITSIAVNKMGDIFIADNSFSWPNGYNHRIRKISKATNIITTVAGNDYPYFSGDGKYLAVRSLDAHAITIDNKGNIIVSDPTNYRIRKIVL